MIDATSQSTLIQFSEILENPASLKNRSIWEWFQKNYESHVERGKLKCLSFQLQQCELNQESKEVLSIFEKSRSYTLPADLNDQSDEELRKICSKLIYENELKTALPLANKIKNKIYQFDILEKIAIEKTKNGELKEALKIVGTLEKRDEALCAISSSLVNQGKVDEAIQVVEQVEQHLTLSNFFLTSIATSINKKKFDLAYELIFKFRHYQEDDFQYDCFLSVCAPCFSAKGQRNFALKIVNNIQDQVKRSETLQSISKHLLKSHGLKKAIQVTKLIPLKSYQTWALDEICNLLIEQKDFKNARKAAKAIRNKEQRRNLLDRIQTERRGA